MSATHATMQAQGQVPAGAVPPVGTPRKPFLTYPAPTRPLSGLVCVKGQWFAGYRQDGKAKRHSLQTTDINTAICRIAEFRKALAALGAVATERGRKRGTAALAAGSRTFVYHRQPWLVKDGKKVIGCYDTEAEAMAARDAHYGLTAAREGGAA